MFGRIALALFSGWLVAVILIGSALQIFSRSQMDMVAAVSVGIGLIVAGIVWRYSRSLAYRAISETEMQNGFDVHLSLSYWVIIIGFGVLTLGTFGLFFWMTSRRFPKRLEPQGITLRNGSFHAWSKITQVTRIQKSIGHVPVTTAWQLEFGNQKADIVARSLREGTVVMQFLSRTLVGDLT